MPLTADQYPAFKAHILANTDPQVVSLLASGATGAIANWYNLDGAFVVWRTTTPLSSVVNAITLASLTPADAVADTAIYANRQASCALRQRNLQLMFASAGQQGVLATGLLNIRQALTDALVDVPSGPGGSLVDAGWLGAGKVKAAISRFARRVEAIYATGTGTAGQPGVLVYDGTASSDDVVQALALP